jgi:hypothetical protein
VSQGKAGFPKYQPVESLVRSTIPRGAGGNTEFHHQHMCQPGALGLARGAVCARLREVFRSVRRKGIRGAGHLAGSRTQSRVATYLDLWTCICRARFYDRLISRLVRHTLHFASRTLMDIRKRNLDKHRIHPRSISRDTLCAPTYQSR